MPCLDMNQVVANLGNHTFALNHQMFYMCLAMRHQTGHAMQPSWCLQENQCCHPATREGQAKNRSS